MEALTEAWVSGSGSGSGEEAVNNTGNDTAAPFELFWPCRHPYSELSRDTTSPFVWKLAPQVQDGRPYVATVEAIFFIVGLLWNIFILLCYCLKPKLLKEPANIYLCNLALIDLLLTILITMPCFIFEVTGEFIFGDSDYVRCHICDFLGVVLHTFISLSLHTMAALSVDRFVILFRPLKYKRIFNWKRALAIQFSLWLASIAISIPPIFGFGKYEFNLVFAACNARWTGKGTLGLNNIDYVTFFGTEAVIPIAILTITNIWVIKIVRQFLKNRVTRQRSFRSDSKDGAEEELKYKRQQNQLIKVFGALFVAHILCWTPVLTVTFIALGIGPSRIPIQVYLVSWLAYLTIPVIHPVLESFFVKDLRYRINKTKKKVRSSLRRAHGSYTSTIVRSFSRRLSRTSQTSIISQRSVSTSSSDQMKTRLDNIPESITNRGQETGEPITNCGPETRVPMTNGIANGSPEILKKRTRVSTVSFKLESEDKPDGILAVTRTSLDNQPPVDDVFMSPPVGDLEVLYELS